MADGASHPNTLHLLYDEREARTKNGNFCAKSVVVLRQQVRLCHRVGIQITQSLIFPIITILHH